MDKKIVNLHAFKQRKLDVGQKKVGLEETFKDFDLSQRIERIKSSIHRIQNLMHDMKPGRVPKPREND